MYVCVHVRECVRVLRVYSSRVRVFEACWSVSGDRSRDFGSHDSDIGSWSRVPCKVPQAPVISLQLFASALPTLILLVLLAYVYRKCIVP